MVDPEIKDGMRFLIMSTRFVPQKLSQDLARAYTLWKEVWDVAFKTELGVEEPLYSDNFSRQSHVAVLFNEQEPIVLTTLNILNLKNICDLDDSYFKVWPEFARRKLEKESKSIITCGNLALNFNYRRGALGVSGKDLIFYLLVKYLKYSSFDSMVAAVRLEKGMDRAAYRTGAHSIMKNVPYTIPGRFVDLVSWSRNLNEESIDPEIKTLANWIWLNRTQVVEREINQGEKNAA